jgi:predicted aldo/keto reductase-like oxidoreductase
MFTTDSAANRGSGALGAAALAPAALSAATTTSNPAPATCGAIIEPASFTLNASRLQHPLAASAAACSTAMVPALWTPSLACSIRVDRQGEGTSQMESKGAGPMGLNRRRFLEATGAGAGLAALAPGLEASAPASDSRVRGFGTLGRTDIRLSDISMGTSRLRTGQERLVHHALDRGVNYFDTADSYTGGDAETVLGNALAGRRDHVYVVSKTKVWPGESRADIMSALEGSLTRLNTDYVDVYFNHAVNDVERLDNPEWYEFADRARQQGKIRFTGMSGHAGHLIDCVDHAVADNLVDVLLVAYNFGQDPAFYENLTRSFDRIATQPGLPGALARAKEKHVGVVAMKTLMGARLNDMRPYERDGATFAQAAFRWTLSDPNVDALVISMTSESQIDEYLGASGSGSVAAGDLDLLRRYARLNGTTYCRQACNDCEGACPYGVPIADVLRTRMYATDYRDVPFARSEYAALEGNAAACVGCSGEPCAGACSHGLDIAALCAPTHRMLS